MKRMAFPDTLVSNCINSGSEGVQELEETALVSDFDPFPPDFESFSFVFEGESPLPADASPG